MSEPFLGHCSVCHVSPIEVRHVNLYVFGSEGWYVCHECEMKVVAFIRQMTYENGEKKMALAIEAKKTNIIPVLDVNAN